MGNGNYNALLRLPDVDAVPAVVLTTARALDAAAPPGCYLEVVRAGLVERGFTDAEADAYLRDCCPRSPHRQPTTSDRNVNCPGTA